VKALLKMITIFTLSTIRMPAACSIATAGAVDVAAPWQNHWAALTIKSVSVLETIREAGTLKLAIAILTLVIACALFVILTLWHGRGSRGRTVVKGPATRQLNRVHP
jgi:hypothetical protein